jgi:predicted glycoside hydrolase/deacetylase ChbG (UPF0249 family)
MKWLIVTADDFGMTSGINRGIIQAHREGILTATSLLVNRPASEEAAALGRACSTLSVGLHLELDPDSERIAAELESQLARFRDLVGAAPTHVDSHHDPHRDPRVLPRVLAWAQHAGVPVRGYAGVRHVPHFYGQWGGETHVEQIAVDGLLRLLDEHVEEGVTELTCHPGYVDSGCPSSYAAEREVELETLCDSRVREALVARDIHLLGFSDLGALASSATAP